MRERERERERERMRERERERERERIIETICGTPLGSEANEIFFFDRPGGKNVKCFATDQQ